MANEMSEKKRHHTERFRGRLVERWTNAKSGYVGFLTGQGYSSVEIEKIMADGTSAPTVRGLWRRWGLPLSELRGDRRNPVTIQLTYSQRAKLVRLAEKRGLTRQEYLRRIAVCAIADDMYEAVTDGEFDE
ncbi:hypothetical protein C7441_11463 [Pseudaminobacter salicylatoxidans]|uniref:Uncharacterized protein n=1 Tax=Pseudaminobacter salicylatoxidans TaxID=93369 RepID=A0A316BYY1_PSESE|nr:hypothetical protein [Pseudaminobacter salicylatoxidans]PWJ79786.1 hypothetical protein C7441_11463 [Pseudaminobacter salicylatoxidans]